MNMFNRQGWGRTLLLAVAVVAVGLSGCGDDNGVNSGGGGGNIVGDWLLRSTKIFTSSGGETGTMWDTSSVARTISSYKSSGELLITSFVNYGNGWQEIIPDGNTSRTYTWRTVGSTLYVNHPDGTESVSKYNVSNGELTTEYTYDANTSGSEYYTSGRTTFTKVDLASYRRSLGL